MRSEKQIEVAVEWWASKLNGDSSFTALSPQERNRPDSFAVAFAEVLATGMQETQTTDAVEKFKMALANKIRAHDGKWLTLSVDYDPDLYLREALQEAGITTPSKFVLPWKTCMWLDDGKVTVREGYGAQMVDLPVED